MGFRISHITCLVNANGRRRIALFSLIKMTVFFAFFDSVLHLPAKEQSGPVYDVIAVLDPLTRAAQKYVPVISVSVNPKLGIRSKIIKEQNLGCL